MEDEVIDLHKIDFKIIELSDRFQRALEKSSGYEIELLTGLRRELQYWRQLKDKYLSENRYSKAS